MRFFCATADDVWRIEECAKLCCDEHGVERTGGPLDWPHYKSVLEHLLDSGNGRMWLYEDCGRIVGGFCGALAVAPLTGLRLASRVFVYVLPEYRGRCSVLRMIRLFERWAKERGCKVASMSWIETMPEGTRRAYEAMNYREQETMFLKVL